MRKKVDDNMYYIGSNIRAARKRADLTQEQLSESIGVTPQYLSDLERGLVGTSISTLMKICRRLNVSADYILFGSSQVAKTESTLIERIQRLPEDRASDFETGLSLIIDALRSSSNQSDKNNDANNDQ